MTNEKIVTRFAPSPTGSLHVGGLRTALYNFVLRQQSDNPESKFIIRIEDTDETRSTDESFKSIIEDLHWAGMFWDEGPSPNPDDLKDNQIGENGPYFQSQRKDTYNGFINELINRGLAYEKDGAVIFSMPKEDIIVPDEILGDVKLPLKDCKDFVVRKSTGMPTFYMAMTVDDHTMGITHVIRGQEHLNTAFRQIALQKALNFNVPKYAHIPLIMNQNGSKMSKRQTEGQVNVVDFRNEGFLPEVLRNYLALLGWAPKDNVEEFDLEFMINNFRLKDVNKANPRFDHKKLTKFNSNHISKIHIQKFFLDCCSYAKHSNILDKIERFGGKDKIFCEKTLELYKPRVKTLKEFFNSIDYLFNINFMGALDEKAIVEIINNNGGLDSLNVVRDCLNSIKEWDVKSINTALENAINEANIPLKQVGMMLRAVITRNTVSPPLTEILDILGKEESLTRIVAYLPQPLVNAKV